jgi:hypothetical protein
MNSIEEAKMHGQTKLNGSPGNVPRRGWSFYFAGTLFVVVEAAALITFVLWKVHR